MAYATEADLRAQFGAQEIDELLDRDRDGSPDTGAADAALEHASAEIDAYLARRFTVPVTGADRMLRGISCDLARYRLYDEAAPEAASTRRDQAISYLRRVADGTAELPGASDVRHADGGVLVSKNATTIDWTGYQ